MIKTNKLNPSEYESKWSEKWLKNRVYQPNLKNSKRPYYNLMMFPYPSAEGLHVGNMYAFTGADINGRYQRMKGFDVFEPIGLDGFGIHSENYAIKVGKHPREQAVVSEQNFYRQLLNIGNGFAWENRLETYDPEYFKWTQWIFVQMFKAGLAYRKKSLVNFCPSCKTVLSDEQVIDGRCERCKTLVEKRDMEQWFFKITKYAERLLQNTYRKDFQWTEKVKIGQRNWIGKKEGINITYEVIGDSLNNKTSLQPSPVRRGGQGGEVIGEITCFTTRPDTNFGATFVVIGPEHSLVDVILGSKATPGFHGDSGQSQNDKLSEEIRQYIEKTKKTSEQDRIAQGRKKTGVFTGFYAVNQLTNYKMPIYIADFVLGHVGTGAVVGVPGHDMRDFEFAQAFNLPVIRVVVGKDGDKNEITKPQQVQEEEGIMINSGFLDGIEIQAAIQKMMDYLEERGWGKRVTTYKLRDWCISRQRYWGAPIPMVYCPSCAESDKDTSEVARRDSSDGGGIRMPGWFPVPDNQLPVLLPDLKDWKPEGTGKGPLAKLKDWVKVICPKCGSEAERETDVCDTFLDSSWYFLRYPSVKTTPKTSSSPSPERRRKFPLLIGEGQGEVIVGELPWDPENTKKWLPVTQYIGGAEHTVLHLLYARFVTMVFKDLGFIDIEEPFSRFYAHGLIISEGAKMSKSRGNVIIPDEYIKKYGADTLRVYLMFLGPFDMGGDFRDTGIAGMYRFLNRVWRLVTNVIPSISEESLANASSNKLRDPSTNAQDDSLMRVMHKTIREVTQDLDNFRYNTAIAHIMEYVNEMTNDKLQITNEMVKTLLLLLAPFVPFMTEDLWQRLHESAQDASGVTRPARRSIGEGGRGSPDGGGIRTTFQSIHLHPWPSFDPKYLVEDTVTIPVQVNGKLRDTIQVKMSRLSGIHDAVDTHSSQTASGQKSNAQNYVEELAKRSERVKKYLEGKTIRKTIFVPGKLINFVV